MTLFIQNAIKDKISDLVSDMFKDMALKLVAGAKATFAPAAEGEVDAETAQAREDANQFGSSVSDLVLAMIATQMVDVLKKDKEHIKEEDFEYKFGMLDRDARKDFGELLRLYLSQLLTTRKSEFVATKGYDGLRDVLRAYSEKKNTNN